MGTNLLVQFISPEIEVTHLQSGLFTLNQFGTRTGSQGTVQFYFQIYLFSNNALIGTSELSNNISTSVDLFNTVFNLTTNIEVSITERLVSNCILLEREATVMSKPILKMVIILHDLQQMNTFRIVYLVIYYQV